MNIANIYHKVLSAQGLPLAGGTACTTEDRPREYKEEETNEKGECTQNSRNAENWLSMNIPDRVFAWFISSASNTKVEVVVGCWMIKHSCLISGGSISAIHFEISEIILTIDFLFGYEILFDRSIIYQ